MGLLQSSVGSGHLDSSGFGQAFFFQPVAVATDVQHGGAMEETIEGGRGHDGIIGKDLRPVGKGLVACEDDRLALFIAFADGLEQETGIRFVERQITDLVDDEQLGPREVFDLAGEPVFGHALSHSSCQIDGGGEVDPMAHLGRQDAEGDGQVCLADSGRPQQDHVAAFAQISARGQLVDDPAVERGLFLEAEVIQQLLIGQVGELQVEPDRFVMTEAGLGIEQIAQEVRVGPTRRGGLLCGLIQLLAGDIEAEILECAGGLLFVMDAHRLAS